MGLVVLSLFDGISCGQQALHRLDVEVDAYYASEVDTHAITLTQHNWPNTVQLGDVQRVKYIDGVLHSEHGEHRVPHVDLLIGGSPCQGFSLAGTQQQFKDARSKLIIDYIRVLQEVKPKYFLLENVRMPSECVMQISNWLRPHGATLHKLNAKRWSAQNRMRYYWTNIPYHDAPDCPASTMQNLVGQGYEGICSVPRGWFKGGVKLKDKCNTITANASWNYNHFVQQNGQRRQFTVHEAEQLFGLPIDYTRGDGSNGKCRRFTFLGNGWSVPVICVLFTGLL